MESVCIKETRCVYDRGRDFMNIGIFGTKITVHNRERRPYNRDVHKHGFELNTLENRNILDIYATKHKYHD